MNLKPIDCSALSFIVMKVEPAMVWEDGGNGRRRQTDEQVRDTNTGMLVWYVHVSSEALEADDYGLDATFRVELQSEERPPVRRGQDVSFEKLRCRTWKTDDGRTGESYRAKSVFTVKTHDVGALDGAVRAGASA